MRHFDTKFQFLFFERTTQDSARLIDIAEKYKATALECHNQEKRKRKQKIELTRLDWDINTGNSTTQSGGTRDTIRKRPSHCDQPPIYTCSCQEDTDPR